MKQFICISILLLYCFSLISATCPPSTPQTNQCGPNLPCADGSCCSAQGFCSLTPAACGCGCQSGACLIPKIVMFQPASVSKLVVGVNTSVTVEITTPINAKVIVSVVQNKTGTVIATTQDTALAYSETYFVQFTPIWQVTTQTGVNQFYYRLSLIDLNAYNADPVNSWQTAMDSSIINGVTIAAAAIQPATTSPPTTKPTNGTSGPTTPGTTGAPTIPTPMYQTILDPAGNPITRQCPISGIDTTHICQACGYTLCQGSAPAFSSCPLGTTCNPVTNTCDPTIYCVNNVASFQAPATSAPTVPHKTVNHGMITSSTISLVIGLIISVMMI